MSMSKKLRELIKHLCETYVWTQTREHVWRVHIEHGIIKVKAQEFSNRESALQYVVKLKESCPGEDVVVEARSSTLTTYAEDIKFLIDSRKALPFRVNPAQERMSRNVKL